MPIELSKWITNIIKTKNLQNKEYTIYSNIDNSSEMWYTEIQVPYTNDYGLQDKYYFKAFFKSDLKEVIVPKYVSFINNNLIITGNASFFKEISDFNSLENYDINQASKPIIDWYNNLLHKNAKSENVKLQSIWKNNKIIFASILDLNEWKLYGIWHSLSNDNLKVGNIIGWGQDHPPIISGVYDIDNDNQLEILVNNSDSNEFNPYDWSYFQEWNLFDFSLIFRWSE